MSKILLVEDNELNRDMLSRRLLRKGYDSEIGGFSPSRNKRVANAADCCGQRVGWTTSSRHISKPAPNIAATMGNS